MRGYSKAAENYRRKILGVVRNYKKTESSALDAVVATLTAMKKDKSLKPSERANLIAELHQKRDGWELLEAAFMIVNDTHNSFSVQNIVPYLPCIHHLLAVTKQMPTEIEKTILHKIDSRGQRRLYTQTKFSVAACIVNNIKLPVIGKTIPIEDVEKEDFYSTLSDASFWKTFAEMSDREKAWFVTCVDKQFLDSRGDRYGKFKGCVQTDVRRAYVVEMDKVLMLPYIEQENRFAIPRDGGSKDVREVHAFSNKGARKLRFLLANSAQAKKARMLKNIAKTDKVLKKMMKHKGVRFAKPEKTFKSKRISNTITWK